jgi:hypothetical protein
MFYVERWQKTALLVFLALAYVLAKNQMCCLCGWLFWLVFQLKFGFFLACCQRFAATRRAGLLPQNFIRRTELSACTNVSAEHETPPFG